MTIDLAREPEVVFDALQTVREALALPASARIERRVAKALVAERGELTTADRRALESGIERLTWNATLTPGSVGVAAFSDDQRDYAEIVVMTAALRPGVNAARVADVLHRAVAHPLALILGDAAAAVLSISLKRRHEREAGRVVAERITVSPSVTGADDAVERAFLASLALATLPAANLWSLHAGWAGRAEAFAAGRITGVFKLIDGEADTIARREAMAAHGAQAREVERLRKAARSERQLRRRVALSGDVTRAEAELGRIARLLD